MEYLGTYNIKPIVSVIPDCKDPKLNEEKPSQDFWEWVKDVQNKGWHIAVHGY
jgi:predicted deacetylase